jgi:hypothetical protein
MVSLRRREMIIAGLATTVVPALSFAAPEKEKKLILSGRILGPDGKPLAGATVATGKDRAVTDADGRFFLNTDTRIYGVTCDGRWTEGFVSNQRRDTDGTWRATCGLRLV